MRRASEKVREPSEFDVALSVIEPSIVGERTAEFLRRRHPSHTADKTAADLKAWRVKSATIAKMLQLRSTPSTRLWIAMMCIYGPEFLCAVLETPPSWLSAAHRAQEIEAIRRENAAIQARLDALA